MLFFEKGRRKNLFSNVCPRIYNMFPIHSWNRNKGDIMSSSLEFSVFIRMILFQWFLLLELVIGVYIWITFYSTLLYAFFSKLKITTVLHFLFFYFLCMDIISHISKFLLYSCKFRAKIKIQNFGCISVVTDEWSD